jgi:tRNA pseudouridine38-40 synthase
MSESTQPEPKNQIWKLTLAYDGTEFRGWQVQPGEVTVQGALQAALGRVTGETPLPQGSGRTDTGVHALAQVASFALRASIPSGNLQRALNRTLPASIRVLSAETMPGTFHARHSTISKTYEYRILLGKSGRGKICSPFLARYVYSCPWPLDFQALESSARCFLGEHDFLSFAATEPDLSKRNTEEEDDLQLPCKEGVQLAVRTIYSSTWGHRLIEDGDLLVYQIRGNGFLHRMVRNLVGTMVEVGRGRLKPEDVSAIFAARSRSAAGPTAPARGLFLHSVEYE